MKSLFHFDYDNWQLFPTWLTDRKKFHMIFLTAQSNAIIILYAKGEFQFMMIENYLQSTWINCNHMHSSHWSIRIANFAYYC